MQLGPLPNRQQPPERKTWLIPVILAPIVFIGLFLGIWQFLTPSDKRVPVAYSDFLTDVHEGRVSEIKIQHEREITYRVETARPDEPSHLVFKETIGPLIDEKTLSTFVPDDPKKAPPKIYFEKE